jgi:chemotaxis protein histidine kinase CheA
MNDQGPRVSAEWLHDVRKVYLESAPRKLRELERAIDGLESNPASHAHQRRLRLLLHNLIGSGGSYGFPAVTETAVWMSESLKRKQDDSQPTDPDILADLRRHLARLRDIFAKYEP